MYYLEMDWQTEWEHHLLQVEDSTGTHFLLLEDARALQFASAEVRCSRLFTMEVIEKKWEALQYLSADLQADREAELPRCEVRLGRTAKRPQPLSGSPRSARGQIRVKGPVDASAAGIVLEFPGGAEEQKK